jgi:hypothetical protein
MSIGSGVFFGALVLAITYLYKITRDRWNWWKIVQRTLIALTSALVVGALGVAVVVVYERIQDIPRKQTGYADLRLAMTMADVKYAKGYPTDVLENPGKENVDTSKLPTGYWRPPTGARLVIPTKSLNNNQRVEDYRSWQYEQTDQGYRIDVYFDDI